MEAKASGHEAAKQNTKKIVSGLKKPTNRQLKTPAATYEDLIRVSLLFEEPSLMLINKSSA
jgi:hypothetical protein